MEVRIDGTEYIPATQSKNNSIGIGITTHNRRALVASTYAKIKALTPDARIVIVDDASEQPVNIKGAEVYRFSSNVGIARAKNKCLELLQGSEHIFLFDDDCYPLAERWYEPYINSPEHHLMYLFECWTDGQPVGDDFILHEDGRHVAHYHPRGCMLYVDSLAVATVGGFDARYGRAMNEHADWSNRIHNCGLTTFRYMDVANSELLIHSMDQAGSVQSSIPKAERLMNRHNNAQLLKDSEDSCTFAPYGKDVVVACYFTGRPDPQRGAHWKPDYSKVQRLQQSVEDHGIEFVLIHDCFDLPNRAAISETPYFERWLKEWQYLRDRRDIDNVFVVDATDVDMVINPFPYLRAGTLYVGDEPDTLANSWMTSKHLEPQVNRFLREHPDLPLLNCGVVGGSRRLVMDLCRDMFQYHYNYPQDETEMGIFNMLCHTKYSDRIEFGRHVTSVFKKFEPQTDAWFRHK